MSLPKTFAQVCPLLFALLGVLSGCSERSRLPDDKPVAIQTELPRHTLVYGGDLLAARRLNLSLWTDSKKEPKRLFSGLEPIFENADIAMINLEGMITTGGYFNQLRSCTWMFRAHPRLLKVLKDIGIDLLLLGNNHNGDYGFEGVVETTDHIHAAGLEYAGAGVDFKDAARPVYFKTGDVVVAIINAELTVGEIYKATDKRPGVFFTHPAFKDHDDELIEHLRKKVEKARRNAHVVLFTPHWDAWKNLPAVSDEMRDLGKRLVTEAGFDAVLGHGRHETQGVEVFDGKPVIYDAGNSLLDFSSGGDKESSRGMLWQVEFSAAGVHKLEGIPIKMKRNRTRLAAGKDSTRVLDRVAGLSKGYGTDVRIANGRAIVDLQPGGVLPPTKKPLAPKRPRHGDAIRYAPTDVLHETLPSGVTPINIQFENGIRLVGYELLSKEVMASKCASQVVVLYWTTDQPLKDSYVVHLEARRVVDGKMSAAPFREEHHLPGDWMLPTTEWPPGKFIQDTTNVRLVINDDPIGEVAFLVGLRKLSAKDNAGSNGELLSPTSTGKAATMRDLIELGRSPYVKGAPSPRATYERWRETRKAALSAVQPPFGAPPLVWNSRTR